MKIPRQWPGSSAVLGAIATKPGGTPSALRLVNWTNNLWRENLCLAKDLADQPDEVEIRLIALC